MISQRQVFAASHVAGFTKACAAQGDEKTSATLQAYYILADEAARAGSGRYISSFGDAVLFSFPINGAGEAVRALRDFQPAATKLWKELDARCMVRVKVGAGDVQCGLMGPAGAEHYDMVGAALNEFFKAPWSDFSVLPEAAALLTTEPR